VVHSVASHCTELLVLMSYNKTPVIQSGTSHCIKLAVWAYLLLLNSVCPLLVSHCTNCASLVRRWPHYWLSSYPILSLYEVPA